jgi:hypothetical protein
MKTTLIICAVLFASFSFTSCGGKKDEANAGAKPADSTAAPQGAGETPAEPATTATTTDTAKADGGATDAKAEAKN